MLNLKYEQELFWNPPQLHILGVGACSIPLTEDNCKSLRLYMEGEETFMLTNRGRIPCSIIRTLSLKLLSLKETELLFNGI